MEYIYNIHINYRPPVIMSRAKYDEILDLLDQAAAPRVTFSEDIDEMRAEALRESERLAGKAIAKLEMSK